MPKLSKTRIKKEIAAKTAEHGEHVRAHQAQAQAARNAHAAMTVTRRKATELQTEIDELAAQLPEEKG